MRLERLTCMLLFIIVASWSGKAQINITNQAPYNTAQYLANDVFSGGNVTITNIQVFGSDRQYGFFDNGSAAIGIDSGVVLSTGSIGEACMSNSCNTTVTGANAPGNGNGTNFGPSWMGTSASNDLLSVSNLAASLVNGAQPASDINDACVIWFDFVPTKDTMQFNFVFASEEWPSFPCSSFNDAFGFFVAGPGINGTYNAPPGFSNAENYAVVPGTNTPITISSINGTGYLGSCSQPNNSQYFIGNNGGTLLNINAYTTLMTVEFPVQQCDTYSFAMAIGDGSDGALSSFVFMEANSFDATGIEIITEPTVETQGGDSLLFEGCGNVDIHFRRLDSVAYADTVPVSISGTAVNGVDYSFISDSLFFAPGQDTATLSFVVFEDNLVEGTEEIVIGIADSTIQIACASFGDSIRLNVEDHIPLQLGAITDDTVTCVDNGQLFSVTAEDGMIPASYSWSSGDSTSSWNYSGSFSADTNFVVTVTDACNVDTIIDTASITVINPPTSISCPDDTITCEDGGALVTVNVQDAMPGLTYAWSTGFTGATFYQQNPFQTTDYIITVSQACAGYTLIDTFTLVVDNPPFVTTTYDDTTTCISPPTQIDVEVTNTTPNFTYQWSTGDTDSSIFVSPAQTTVYYVTVTDACGVNSSVDSVTVWVFNSPTQLSGANQSIDCVGDIVPLTLNIQGGYAPHTIMWENGDTDTTSWVTASSDTSYTVSVTDVCAIDTVDYTFNVVIRNYPDLGVTPFPDLTVNCPGTPFSFGRSNVYGGSGDYIVSWTDWTDSVDFLAGVVDTTTTFYLEVFDRCNYDSAFSEVTVFVADHDPLKAVIHPDTHLCPGDEVELFTYPIGGGGNYSYKWSNGQTDSAFVARPLSPQLYKVVIEDDCGELAREEVQVDVSQPDAAFTYEFLDGTNVIFANGSQLASTYVWDFGDGTSSTEEDPWHQYEVARNHYVVLHAYDDFGCHDSTFAEIDPPLLVYIPSGFTPNGDGLNDVFKVYGEGFRKTNAIKGFKIFIFDRWGTEIYKSNSVDFEWDGSVNGQPAQAGSFVYRIIIEGYNRQKFEKTGTITIASYSK